MLKFYDCVYTVSEKPDPYWTRIVGVIWKCNS